MGFTVIIFVYRILLYKINQGYTYSYIKIHIKPLHPSNVDYFKTLNMKSAFPIESTCFSFGSILVLYG